ncbi:MAG: hypothetical protein WBX03_10810 [Terriglobales bacterium]|jgi:hypothetical protein
MMVTILWNLMITAGFISCVVIAAWIWFHFPDRTADDVVDFLLPVDLEKVETLLDATAENHLRCDLSRRDFRKMQRKRIHLYVALVHRMAHNAAVLIDWANREAEGGDEQATMLAHELQQIAVEVRLYALLTMMKLRLWLLLRLDSWQVLPAPSLYEVREVGGILGLESYDRLKTAASFLFLEMGRRNFDELLHNL